MKSRAYVWPRRIAMLIAAVGVVLLATTLLLRASGSLTYKTVHDAAWMNEYLKYLVLAYVAQPPTTIYGYNLDYASDDNVTWYRDIDLDASGKKVRYIARKCGFIYTLYDCVTLRYVGVHYNSSDVPSIPLMYVKPPRGRGP